MTCCPWSACASLVHSAIGRQKSQFKANDDVQSLGVTFCELPPGPLIVKSVLRGFWAYDQGIKPGDEVLTINGRAARDLSRQDFCRMIGERPIRFRIEPPLSSNIVDEADVASKCNSGRIVAQPKDVESPHSPRSTISTNCDDNSPQLSMMPLGSGDSSVESPCSIGRKTVLPNLNQGTTSPDFEKQLLNPFSTKICGSVVELRSK